MALVSLNQLCLSYGGPLLLDHATLHIERGERICLIGRNGEGKSSLMRLLAGEERPDHGEIAAKPGTVIRLLAQAVPRDWSGAVFEAVRAGIPSDLEDWQADLRVETLLSQWNLNGNHSLASLSGGQSRRVLLARALAAEPDLLLLDEPTNHLDIPTIEALEASLLKFPGAVLFVTHDRTFLRRLATRIVELDRGQLTSWDCDYDRYLERRAETLAAEEKQNALFDKKLAAEEVWIRQGIKARRTRNEGRVRALEALRRERAKRRERLGTATLQLQTADRSGEKVIVAQRLSYAWNGVPCINDFSTLIERGDKIGIIGPNGCGKTTLINLLLGLLPPDTGNLHHGTKLEIAYFDQHRASLDPAKTVIENVCGEDSHVIFNGARRHIISYLEDFLFPPDRSRCLVRVLSGGERNRLLLAKLFTQPANLLVMDEPTNDLDAETLELLENLLVEYTGTLLLVSHDRNFLNQVISSSFVFTGQGHIEEVVGGYDEAARVLKARPTPAPSPPPPPRPAPAKPRKITSQQRKELNQLPARIETLEAELATLEIRLHHPDFFKQDPATIQSVTARIAALPREIEAAYTLWSELEPSSD
ncbi:MAG TPA: ATP-binding cassette domain-containing protein [Kiritimatiellia bacterium]|nr:ATP-binding cassette domain-containing protein [Kiritimatiellia bacterium]